MGNVIDLARKRPCSSLSIDALIEYAITQIVPDFGTVTSIERRRVLSPSFYLFLERGRYAALSARREVLIPEGGFTAERAKEPTLIYDPLNSFSRRLSFNIPKQELETFLGSHGGFPQSGVDVLVITSVRESLFSTTPKNLIYFPGVTSLGYLIPENVTAISRVGLAYLRPTSPETMAQQKFVYPS